MPLYEYKCESCGKTFETIQKFSDTPLEVHDECGGKVIRLISRSALQFKGSGWYVNDYARSGNGQGKENKDGKGNKDGKDTKYTKKESTGSSDSSAKSETKTSSSTPASSSGKSDKKV
jgi:putative FmdB family regulatory protein